MPVPFEVEIVHKMCEECHRPESMCYSIVFRYIEIIICPSCFKDLQDEIMMTKEAADKPADTK